MPWSVCLSVDLSVTCASVGHVRLAKTTEPIEMPFGRLTDVCLSKHVVYGGQGRTNPFAAARGDKTAMWSLVKIF